MPFGVVDPVIIARVGRAVNAFVWLVVGGWWLVAGPSMPLCGWWLVVGGRVGGRVAYSSITQKARKHKPPDPSDGNGFVTLEFNSTPLMPN